MDYVMDTGEHIRIEYSLEYLDYLKSAKWAEISRTRRLIDNNRCQMCGAEGVDGVILDCHHLTYKSGFGNENVWSDVVTVCRSCHKLIHHMMMRQTSADGRHGWADEFYVPMYNSANKELVKGG